MIPLANSNDSSIFLQKIPKTDINIDELLEKVKTVEAMMEEKHK
jgi:hypothetical protein